MAQVKSSQHRDIVGSGSGSFLHVSLEDIVHPLSVLFVSVGKRHDALSVSLVLFELPHVRDSIGPCLNSVPVLHQDSREGISDDLRLAMAAGVSAHTR